MTLLPERSAGMRRSPIAQTKIYRQLSGFKRNALTGYRCRLERAGGRRVIHFLHIGKTAGSALKYGLQRANESTDRQFYFALRTHLVRLHDIPPEDDYIFSVRDPLKRFYSGFYSRKRKGQPSLFAEWTPAEEWAFRRFPEANDLAEALSAEDEETRCAALSAMKAIGHVRTLHLDWFDDPYKVFYGQRQPLMVLRQKSLGSDFRALADWLGLPSSLELPEDELKAHRNDYSRTPPLTPAARENIKLWYAYDIAFVAHAERFAARRVEELSRGAALGLQQRTANSPKGVGSTPTRRMT